MMKISIIILLGLALSSFSLYVTNSNKASLLTLSFSKRSIAANDATSTKTNFAVSNSNSNSNNNDSKSSKRNASINTDVSIEVNDDFRSGNRKTTTTTTDSNTILLPLVVKGYQREKSPKKMIKLLQSYNTSGMQLLSSLVTSLR